MKKPITSIVSALLMCCCFMPELLADASAVTRVQTFTFDSLYTRRGTWKFPDAGKKYRKIIMNYTLKCDPRTAEDNYSCGEWDALTYNVVYHKTGRDTSYAKTAPRYKLGLLSPDTLLYGENPVKVSTSRNVNTCTIKSASGETEYGVFSNIKTMPSAIISGQKAFRIQYFITNAELKTLGIDKKTVGRLKLQFANATGATLKNLQIKLFAKPGSFVSYWADDMTEVYNGDYTVTGDVSTVDLNQDFVLKALNGLIVEISADGFDRDDAELLGYSGLNNTLSAIGTQKYLKFDGTNDYVYTDSTGIMPNASCLTYEADVRIDKWKSWSKILGIGDRVHWETGSNEGELYFMVRNGMNSYAKVTGALPVGKWVHVSTVFDGTKATNAEKVKIYINGVETPSAYAGVLPATTSADKNKFMVSSAEWASAPVAASIRDVRVWDKALTPEEITEWFASPVTSEHPEYASLLLNYSCENPTDDYKIADAGNRKINAAMYGFPELMTLPGEEMNSIDETKYVPAITLIEGNYTRENSSSVVTSSYEADGVTLAEYEISGYSPVIKSVKKVWKSGLYYSYDESGNAIDSTNYNGGSSLLNEKLQYMTAPTAVIDTMEIGRFITPYGINLDLGPDGFSWRYDVTDYADYLIGDVDFAAGDQRELLDVSFDFYEGEPAREVLRIDQPWGAYKGYYYKDMSADKSLKMVTVNKLPETKQLMMKTRFTGHGHNSNDGSYPHCCEWKDNTHTLYTNLAERQWHVWQTNDCALNPVFPQGGTWPGSREGWCPGDVVKDNDFEITEYVDTENMAFDYEITPVPENNLGMGNGMYIVAMQLFEYGAATHATDAEVWDIIAPNNLPLYSRMNPICAPPKVIIRNNGNENLTSLHFDYYVTGGETYSYDWSDTLAPNLRDTVELPIDVAFWAAANSKVFNVKISSPNGKADEYTVNDTMSTPFNLPDIIAVNSVLVFHAPASYQTAMHLTVKDIEGNIVVNRNSVYASSWYRDTLRLPDGCYTMEILDDYNQGISYWANPDLGTGSLTLYAPDGGVTKVFEPDFGRNIIYSFSIGALTSVEDRQIDNLLRIYPNPVTDGDITLRLEADLGKAKAELFDASGRLIFTNDVSGMQEAKFNVENLPAGSYYFRVTADNYVMHKNFIRK